MDEKEFVHFRKRLGKTQKELSQLFGTSVKAVQGYEQGWRSIPGYIERQLIFLTAVATGKNETVKSCWVIKKCPPDRKKKCPAWEFRAGKICWFINGTICEGVVQKDWKEKMMICRTCEVFRPLLPRQEDTETEHEQ